MKRLALLGSTGSIGCQTLQVVAQHPQHFKIVGLAARRASPRLLEQVKAWQPEIVSVENETEAAIVSNWLRGAGEPYRQIQVRIGEAGLIATATWKSVDLAVMGVVGAAGLLPTLKAIEAKKQVALANKEVLVAGGPVVAEALAASGTKLIPIDSEHSAILQCLQGEKRAAIKKLVLTASGGPFLNTPPEAFSTLSVESALNHPNWKMGDKITIDSATLMNKGLEVIEAHWLFDIPYEQIEVVIHPQSMVHSMVAFQDGSVKAQLGTPDMRVPIQYALSYPDRLAASWPPLEINTLKDLTFQPPDLNKFPCLRLAYEAGEAGGVAPAVLNAANEEAVKHFLAKKIPFTAIPAWIESALAHHTPIPSPTLEDILAADHTTRTWLQSKLPILSP